MRKEIKIAMKLDNADFDRSVEQMQKKLKDLYAPSDMIRQQQQTAQRMGGMGMPGMSAPTQGAYQQASQQSRRELDQLIQTEARRQERMVKNINEREKILKNLQSIEAKGLKSAQEELLIKEKILKIEQNIAKEKQTYSARDQAINQLMDIKQQTKPQGFERLATAYQNGGIGGAITAGKRMLGPAGVAGFIGGGMGLIGAGMGQAAELYRDWNAGPIRSQAAYGNAVAGTYGKDVGNIYSRRTGFEANFSPERSKAAQMAIEKMQANRVADRLGLAGNMLEVGGGIAAGIGGGIAGAGKGAAIGTAIGTAVPGIGNAAGATAGAWIGGIAGAAPGAAMAGHGMWSMLSDERKRSLMLSPISKTANDRYESNLAEQLSSDYNTSVEAQKKQNPFKTMAVDEYSGNFQRNVDFQRQMGMSNNQFYGGGPGKGFLQQGAGAGYTPEMMMQMSSGIMSAGGSTRVAKNGQMSAFGLDMQKNMDLTNADQILGKISGSVGNSDATKSATIKIISEAMKLGLDSSQFAEENRRFTQAAAEIVGRTGANKDSDFDRISQGFSRYMNGDNTSSGIGAAKNAYEQYQGMSSQVTGARGVMRFAGFMGDKDLSKLSIPEQSALAQVKEEDLNENNPLVANAMLKTGLSSEEVTSKISNVNRKSVSRNGDFDKRIDRLKKGMKDYGLTELNSETIKKLPKELQQDYGMAASYFTQENGFTGSKDLQSAIAGQVGPNKMPIGVAALPDAKGKLEGSSGRMEDNTIASMAADAGTVLKNFNEMRGGMDDAAKSAALFTDKIREMNVELMKALASGDKKAIEGYLKNNPLNSAVQPQVGKASK